MNKLLSLFCCVLVSCVSKVEKIASIDQTQKTIAVQQGGGEVTLALKKALRENGWRVLTDTGMTVNPGGGVPFAAGDAQRARYSLSVEGVFIDKDIAFRSVYQITISVVDNVSRQEVMTLTGTDVTPSIVKKTMAALQ